MRSLEKHESMGEEPDHCVKNRKCNRRGKELREQRVQRAQGKVPHYTTEEEEARVRQASQGWEHRRGGAPRKLQDYYVNRDVLRW